MMQQETAPVPVLSKKTKQVTVTMGKSQLLDSAAILLYPVQCSLCPSSSCWPDFREAFTFSALKEPCFTNNQQARPIFPPNIFFIYKCILQ